MKQRTFVCGLTQIVLVVTAIVWSALITSVFLPLVFTATASGITWAIYYAVKIAEPHIDRALRKSHE